MTLVEYAIAVPPLVSGPLDLAQIDSFLEHFVERRELAQLLDHVYNLCRDVIYLFLRIEPAEAEANGGVRQIVARAERFQDVAGLERRRGARRSARYCNVVNSHQQRFAFHVSEADVQIVRQPVFYGAVDVNL